MWIYLYLGCLLASPPKSLNLTLIPEVKISGEEIRLGDIVSRSCQQSLDRSGLTNLVMANGPLINASKVLYQDQVRIRLMSTYPGIDLSISGAPSVRIHRPGQPFPRERLAFEVRHWIEARGGEGVKCRADQITVPGGSAIPKGHLGFSISRHGTGPLVGRCPLHVDLYVDQSLIRSVMVQAQISVETQVARATRHLSRHERLQPEDVNWETLRLDRVNGRLITPEEVTQLRARTLIRPGTLLTSNLVEPLPLVERNHTVDVVVEQGPLLIRMRALALDQGAMGESIRVKNVDSGAILTVSVTGPSETALNSSHMR